jgi:hypothetical protein
VNIADRMWARLVSSTNQPNFVCYNKFVQQLHKQNTLNQADEIESYVVAEISKSAATSPSSSDGNGNGHAKRGNKEIPQMEISKRRYV